MKTIYVEDLKKGDRIELQTFAVFDVVKGLDKNGNPFYSITIGDKTGRLNGKIWSDTLAKINKKIIKPEKLVGISGDIGSFKGELQIKVTDAVEVDETEIDDFIESSKYDPKELMKILNSYISKIKDSKLKKAIEELINDEEVKPKFMYWPAANTIHHGFRSGLLQHICEMLDMMNGMRQFYTDLNYDVMTAGIVLHDIGKLEEMSGGLSSNYTKKGSLLGHITIGVNMFMERAKKHGVHEDIMLHVAHIILSHHGILEYGSPVVPATPEATAVSHIDNLSSKVMASLKIVSELGEDQEFSRPYAWLENGRFWRDHNKNTSNSSDTNLNESSSPETNDDGNQLLFSTQ